MLSAALLMILMITWPLVATADLFTSIADMELLLETEKELPEILESYIERFEQRLDALKQLWKRKKQRVSSKLEDSMRMITNPISAYLFIKEMIEERDDIKRLASNDVGDELLNEISEVQAMNNAKNPAMEDLTGASMALLRLQDTYRLDVKEMANGKILNVSISQSLTARDCFDIGRAAYSADDHYHTIMWMQEALERLQDELPNSTVNVSEILEYLAFSMFKQDNLKRALILTDKLLKISPDHPRAKNNIQWYEDLLAKDGIKADNYRRNIPPINNRRPSSGLDAAESEMYEALCRNEVPVSVKETSKLYCYYKMDRPFLRLAPFKIEILRFSPLAVLFRGVITDDEVELIQFLAKPKLRRATVQNSVTGELETASYRISKRLIIMNLLKAICSMNIYSKLLKKIVSGSKSLLKYLYHQFFFISAWLKDDEHEIIRRINRRIGLMTNLEQETSEDLQVGNYGIGGHYDPHFDFARKEEVNAFQSLNTGNRLATVLFYMTQPESGGATVFTHVRTTVLPSKNDALFWYNLLRSGEGDFRTRHAACPVLTGVKWVSNKWIHERGQEFHRPCGLQRSIQDRFVGDLGGHIPRNHWNIRAD
ncbi:unnamed protein product [Thelazia callipaeda]|uniref:procollagen-proline 4-dioxygenase n=1 Tax=Thelazia callipaeda TaxID=103827 RepID=A0A0N5CZS3_THECL|nr:unnamed protein product [Thelazia callipaeda]